MDDEAFRAYLKRGGRSESAISRCLHSLADFDAFLAGLPDPPAPGRAGPAQLQAFVEWAEAGGRYKPRVYLWALKYYFHFADNEEMATLAGGMRQARIRRRPFQLADFLGVDPGHAARLAEAGVTNVAQMLAAGATPAGRRALAKRSGVTLAAVEELARLADLARLDGVKGVRARLYLDAGIGSVQALAAWEPTGLRAHLLAHVAASAFPGIAPLPKEVAAAIRQARRLPPLVSWEDGPG